MLGKDHQKLITKKFEITQKWVLKIIYADITHIQVTNCMKEAKSMVVNHYKNNTSFQQIEHKYDTTLKAKTTVITKVEKTL